MRKQGRTAATTALESSVYMAETAASTLEPRTERNLYPSEWRLPAWCSAGLVLLGACAVSLRVHGITRSLWIDELATAWAAGGPLSELYSRTVQANGSPVYYLLVRVSLALTHLPEVGARLPSLFASLVFLGLLWRFSAECVNRPIARLWVLFVAVFDARAVEYAQWARPYSLVQCTTLVALAAVYNLTAGDSVGRKSKSGISTWRVLWVLSAVVSLYLHLATAFTVAVFSIALVFAGRRDYAVKHRLLDLVAIGAASAGLLPQILFLLRSEGVLSAFITPLGLDSVITLFGIPRLVIYPAVVALCVGGLVLRERNDAGGSGLLYSRQEAAKRILALALFGVGPMFVAAALSEAHLFESSLERYHIVGHAAAYLLSGIVLDILPSALLQVVFCGVVTGFLCMSAQGAMGSYLRRGKFASHVDEGWRSATQLVNADSESDIPVLLSAELVEENTPISRRGPHFSSYMLAPLATYPIERHPVVPLLRPERAHSDRDLEKMMCSANGAWLLIRGRAAANSVLKRLVDGTWATHGVKVAVEEQHEFGEVVAVRTRAECS